MKPRKYMESKINQYMESIDILINWNLDGKGLNIAEIKENYEILDKVFSLCAELNHGGH